jgi:hypothetical protein
MTFSTMSTLSNSKWEPTLPSNPLKCSILVVIFIKLFSFESPNLIWIPLANQLQSMNR